MLGVRKAPTTANNPNTNGSTAPASATVFVEAGIIELLKLNNPSAAAAIVRIIATNATTTKTRARI